MVPNDRRNRRLEPSYQYCTTKNRKTSLSLRTGSRKCHGGDRCQRIKFTPWLKHYGLINFQASLSVLLLLTPLACLGARDGWALNNSTSELPLWVTFSTIKLKAIFPQILKGISFFHIFMFRVIVIRCTDNLWLKLVAQAQPIRQCCLWAVGILLGTLMWDSCR